MLKALLADLAETQHPLTLLLHERWRDEIFLSESEVFWVNRFHPFTIRFRQALQVCRAVWLIAPESGGILETLNREVEHASRILFGTPPEGIIATADKWQTFLRLKSHGLSTPETVLATDTPPPFPPPWVVKPRDGCGSENIMISEKVEELPKGSGWIVQPWLSGEAFSLSFACCDGEAVLLSVNQQRIARRGRELALSGCRVGVCSPFDAEAVAAEIARAFPELRGYVGVDLIYDGHSPWIIEINPRLTLSYVGLSRAAGKPTGAILTRWLLGELPFETLRELWSWQRLRPVLV